MATDTAVAEQAGTRTRTKAKKPQKAGTPWWMWIAVAAIVVFCLFPFYWLVSMSLKTGADLSESKLIPPNPTLANYKSIFQNDDFTRARLNSTIISVVTTVLAIVVGSFCAYALARLRFGMMRPISVLKMPMSVHRRNSGAAIAICGNVVIESTMPSRITLPRILSRASA